ncbi:MAG: hypothetical protein ACNA8W_12185, partial [Bradymonadaceae bacterium]
PCAAYNLAPGSTVWTRRTYADLGLDTVLDGPVIAAFDVESRDIAFLFTRTSFYKVSLPNLGVLRTGSHSALHPRLDGTYEIHAAYSVPAAYNGKPSGRDDVIFAHRVLGQSNGRALVLEYLPASDGLGPSDAQWVTFSWAGDTDPPPANRALRALWLDVDNARGWLGGSSSCGVYYGAYQAAVTTDRVHLRDTAACMPFDFVKSYPLSSFTPFTYTRAPVTTEIGATFWWNGHLFVFPAP